VRPLISRYQSIQNLWFSRISFSLYSKKKYKKEFFFLSFSISFSFTLLRIIHSSSTLPTQVCFSSPFHFPFQFVNFFQPFITFLIFFLLLFKFEWLWRRNESWRSSRICRRTLQLHAVQVFYLLSSIFH